MAAIDMAAAVLLSIHIAAGAVSLAAALAALAAAKGARHHVRAGRVYAAAMTMVCASALPLAVRGADIVLLLVAVFSFYLVFAGWRAARNAAGRAGAADRVAAALLALTGLGMWSYGAMLFRRGDPLWVPLAVFGAIAAALSAADLRYHRMPRRAGAERIARHLTHMLAGAIATVTAVAVVNLATRPPWLAWILPAVVLTPLIVWWNRRVRRGMDWHGGPAPAPAPGPHGAAHASGPDRHGGPGYEEPQPRAGLDPAGADLHGDPGPGLRAPAKEAPR